MLKICAFWGPVTSVLIFCNCLKKARLHLPNLSISFVKRKFLSTISCPRGSPDQENLEDNTLVKFDQQSSSYTKFPKKLNDRNLIKLQKSSK